MGYVTVSAAAFWQARMAGRTEWVIAVAPMMCAYQRLGTCTAGSHLPAIVAGDRCFDTGDRIGDASRAAIVLCSTCATAEIPDAAFDLA